MILVNDNEESRRTIESCFRRHKTVLNPIIDWEDEDVWEFIRTYNVPYCELYDQGFERIGCIGCPLNRKSVDELERYPKYKANYIKAFARMLEERKKSGRIDDDGMWTTPQGVFDWWVGKTTDKPLSGQIDINELMELEE